MIDHRQGGTNWMGSVWRLNAEEIALLQAGHGLVLWVQGLDHPVVAMSITDNSVADVPVVP
ncbi:hypothetical protein Phage2-1_00101 [Achromobacter phage 2-1]|nr:hypothetical protein Phage2-1_00101 [Achromobacter phage 2-1]